MTPHFVDSHCHLDYFPKGEREAVLTRAADNGVLDVVTIGTRLTGTDLVETISSPAVRIWSTVGVHPLHVGEGPAPSVSNLVALTRRDRVIGVGETGLDYKGEVPPRDMQVSSFLTHIEAARQSRLPVVIHAREADADLCSILREEHEVSPFKFVLHSFSSGVELARLGVALGGFVSFSGILTFKKSDELRDIASMIPLDRLLIETDAPYLAPVPKRGRVNEPAYLPLTAAVLADVRSCSLEDIADQTVANFRLLFDRAA